MSVSVKLEVAGSTTAVSVEAEGGDLVENVPGFHTDVDKNLFDKLPLESQSSSVSSPVTLSKPGIAADSNGLFHGLGDYAENSFSVDFHGFSALAVFSSVATRFFTPRVGGVGAVPSAVLVGGSVPFRIDHEREIQSDHALATISR